MEMKAIVIEQIGSFVKKTLPVKEPSDNEVLIKVEVTGLCRTDLKIVRVGHRDLVMPRVPGEEVVGTVIRKGTDVTGVAEGSRVYVYPGIWCGECRACRALAENLCRGMQIMGFHRDGGFAEYVTVPAQSIIPIEKDLAAEKAVFAEPLSCCLNALELADIKPGKAVGIWGAGPAGTLLARAAAAHGAQPFNIEPDERRREIIGGFEKVPDCSFDICVIAVGDKSAYEQALQRLEPRGRLVVFAGLSPDNSKVAVDFNQMHYHEQTIVGAYGCCYRHGVEAIELISSGRVQVEDMISHRMPLWDLDEALSIVENKTGMKILLYP